MSSVSHRLKSSWDQRPQTRARSTRSLLQPKTLQTKLQFLYVTLCSIDPIQDHRYQYPRCSSSQARQRTGGGYKWRTDLNAIITEYLEKGVELRKDWDEVCDDIMEKAVYAKFSQNNFLKQKLLSTCTPPLAAAIASSSVQPSAEGKGKEKINPADEKEEEEEEGRSGEKAPKPDAQQEDNKGPLDEGASGDIVLMEHTSRDSYWADGGDGSGVNMLGKILMRVRSRLKAEANKD